MADAGIALTTAQTRTVNDTATAAQAEAIKETRKSHKKFKFERLLVASALLIAAAGLFESVTQKYNPAYSALSLIHSYGYLKSLPVIYEPSKGLWYWCGWAGSVMMVLMMVYSLRKHFSFIPFGSMRNWLNFHMFLGITGPALITFHTTFKFHGLIATSYWSMVLTVAFGILGRYIYLQIPRSINGAEMGVKDIEKAIGGIERRLEWNLDASTRSGVSRESLLRLVNEIAEPQAENGGQNAFKALLAAVRTDLKNRYKSWKIRSILMSKYGLGSRSGKEAAELIMKKAALIRKKNFLAASHKLLKYWHVVHIPLAIVMFSIMVLHVIIYYIFRP